MTTRRSAVITGGASGLGRAMAERFAVAGMSVAVVDRDAVAAKDTASAIAAGDKDVIPVRADVADRASVQAAMTLVAKEFGRIDVLCNNAGIGAKGSIVDAEEADWDRCIAVNVKSAFLCTQAALPHLQDAGGVVLNTASVAGLVAIHGVAAAYSASKGALIALTRSMAVDLAPKGIRVNAICPGTVRTPIVDRFLESMGDGDVELGVQRVAANYPLARLGTTEEIADAAFFLASDAARFITGAVLAVDGGYTAQ